MQQLQIIGNIGQDAQIKETNGRKWVSFSVAIDESYKDRTGTKVEKTTWIDVGTEQLNLAPYLLKGTKIFAQGKMRVSPWEDQQKNIRVNIQLAASKIELLSAQQNRETAPSYSRPTAPQTQRAAAPSPAPVPAGMESGSDDDLPF